LAHTSATSDSFGFPVGVLSDSGVVWCASNKARAMCAEALLKVELADLTLKLACDLKALLLPLFDQFSVALSNAV